MSPKKSSIGLALLAVLHATAAADTPEAWSEVRSPHFLVITDGRPEAARRVAWQFEQIRALFQAASPQSRVDSRKRVLILAARNEKSLRMLLPSFWEQKGAVRPAGVFLSGPEKHYIALRLDTPGENPYYVLYHEYIHSLVSLNFDSLPLWVNEGLAEFYGISVLKEDDVTVGKANRGHLELLRANTLLPLSVLMSVDRSSPHYNERTKASIFYAQSWALVHYLALADTRAHANQLEVYLRLLANRVDRAKAAGDAFGDLTQLGKALTRYVDGAEFYMLRIKIPLELAASDFGSRQLSRAESCAIRGDFHVYMNRPAEAQAFLEEAIRLEPNLAAPHESMGLLFHRQSKPEDARKAIGQAVKLDSGSYLAHYLQATFALADHPDAESAAQIEAALQRSVSLNDRFPPAYAALGEFYRWRGDFPRALNLAQRAVSLEPGIISHQIVMGRILAYMGKLDEARRIGERARQVADTEADRLLAEGLLESVRILGQSVRPPVQAGPAPTWLPGAAFAPATRPNSSDP